MPWLLKKWLAKWVKKFFHRFSWKFPYTVIFLNKCPGNLFKNLIFKGTFIWVEHLFTNKHLAFFFDTRQAIEKTTNLQNYKSIQNYKITNLLLDEIHFFIGILFIKGINEWIYGIFFCQLKLIAFVFQLRNAVLFLNNA